ncbi:hypothetical protein pqer_cds_283 [Pandoravirus quercus]|uniref:Uncharacterized protein n=2 Tax=Pandoravirus TaxID=2060084 RepID=A0A2U7U8J3_9VIRU|nr:hypothetical protein pqer_cds_283 [Pandoravirus quercus]AVK74705.1 hypothetical protein pqer_cds_283 [Pandoravirus quercus]QBZ80881.1 hypothetical protein pclt_cds_283 [Pandoravirus celtis]
MSEGQQETAATANDGAPAAVEERGTERPDGATEHTADAVVVITNVRYCRATGCVMAPLTINNVSVHANWAMSSPHNIIGPAASKRVRCTRTNDNIPCLAAVTTPVSNATGDDARASDDAATGDTARSASRSNARRAWPTVCHAVGTTYRPRTLSVGGVVVRPRQNESDIGIEFLRADRVRLSTLSGAQLAHRAAQAHTSIVSVARPTTANGPHSLLARLVADGAMARPSVLWDMRAVPQSATIALGLAAPVSDPNVALVRLYTPDHPEVVAAGDERITGLARTAALVRLLGIEVAVTPESPTLRLALVGPEWAVIDVGVRACYFDQETRADVVGALARAGPASWRTCPLWARGTVLAAEAAGALDLPASEAPVLALVLAGYDPMRPVRLRLTRDAYVHTSPPHEVQFRWTDPMDRVTAVASESRSDDHVGGDSVTDNNVDNGDDYDNNHGGDGSDDKSNSVALHVQYTQVDLAAWMNRAPDGTCLIGNCAFEGRAVLVDYEANALAVFAADARRQ